MIFHSTFTMSTPPFSAETVAAIADTGVNLTLADMANIFEFAASRLLAIRTTLENSTRMKSAKARHNMSRYLMWEGDVSVDSVSFCRATHADRRQRSSFCLG